MSQHHVRARRAALAASILLIAYVVPASAQQPSKPAKAENPSHPGVAPAASADSPQPPPPSGEAIPGYFRVDTDGLGTQLWFGAIHKVGDVNIASDVYVVGTAAELDLGVTLTVGELALTPMAGITFDFAPAKEQFSSLVAPQLFTTFDPPHLHFESWVQFFFNSVFVDGAENDFYTRDFLLYKLGEVVAIGPQIEVTARLNSVPGTFESGLVSLPIGGRINVAYGKSNTLGVFVGYDTHAPAGADGVAGRVTFVRTW